MANTKWRMTSTNDPYAFKMLSKEEKVEYYKNKKARERKLFKLGQAIDRMEVNKPKLNHPSSHKNTKEIEEE